jgi:HD-GYP domain-containing protein (c-di-GMP phosphodiesterase class II)/ribonuclease BN (tRNA processing enzyme)
MRLVDHDIRFLGTGGSKSNEQGTSCVQISDNLVIDAGNILNGLGEEAKYIEHIFLTHSHLDHVSDIAFLIDNYFTKREKSLKIYGLKETIEALKNHIFNWDIWPDFSEIPLLSSGEKSVEFVVLEYKSEYKFNNVTLKPIALNHTVPTCGYIIKKENFSCLYACDTYKCDAIWDEVNSDLEIDSIVIDVSFPSDMENLAQQSKHLTPRLLKEELKKLNRDDISIYVTHLKPIYQEVIEQELRVLDVLLGDGRVVKDGEYLKNITYNKDHNKGVLEISTALSKEKDLNKILSLILVSAMDYTKSEGGTIYLKEGDKISFKAVKNDKLNIFEINNKNFPKIDLYPNGKENKENVSAVCALTKETINIPDIYLYHIGEFNFDGAKKFDKENGYKTESMLVVPMLSNDDKVVGVMQLINKKSLDNVTPFTSKDIEMTTTYANLCASAINKNKLIDDLEKLVLSFLESISYALSVKSPYGYEHISRVKELMGYIAKEIDSDETIYKDISYTKEEFQELELAAWMHDIGKIATPEHILDKATRLENLQDQVYMIEMRFNYVKYYLKTQILEAKCAYLNGEYQMHIEEIENRYEQKIKELESDLLFIKQSNQPSTYMHESDIQRVNEISQKSFYIDNQMVNLLTPDEVKYLSIVKGTLTDDERDKINEHAKITHDMLNMITFPKKYSNVTKIASGHHEKLNGKGYPLGLSGDEISFETRILAIVDILEALTASDRPYKRAKTEKETFEILDAMVDNGELDKYLVTFIKESKIFDRYIKKESKSYFVKQEEVIA